MNKTLTLKACAAKLGVHYMTAYRYVRLGMLHAEKVGAEWQVTVEDFEEFRKSQQSAPKRGRGGFDAPWTRRLEARLVAGDERGSWQVVEAAMAAGLEPTRIYTDVLGPALCKIGEDWHEGVSSIADEHRATAIASRIVGRLSARFTRRGRDQGRVVIGTPAGEGHALPVAMVSDMFRGAGFEVIELGTDLPITDFVDAAVKAAPLTAVAVSVTNSAVLDGVSELTGALHAAVDAPVVIGGHAIRDQQHALQLGADSYAADGPAALSFATGLLA